MNFTASLYTGNIKWRFAISVSRDRLENSFRKLRLKEGYGCSLMSQSSSLKLQGALHLDKKVTNGKSGENATNTRNETHFF